MWLQITHKSYPGFTLASMPMKTSTAKMSGGKYAKQINPQHIKKPNIVCEMLPRHLKHKLLKKKFGFSSCAAYFFFFFAHLANFIPANCQRFLLEKISTYAGRPTPASAPRFGLTAVNACLTCGRQSSPHPLATEETQNGHKKSITLLLVENWICRKTKFNWAADHTVSPEKNVLFSSLSSWHALLSYACPPCLYSSCWMHVKVKIFSTFQRDVVLQRSSMSLLAQAISARCPRSTSRRGKVDGIDKMFCSICERASRRSRHWFVKRGRYICLFKACLVVVLYGQTIDQSFERFCSFFVKGTVWNNLSNLLTQFNVFVHK